MLTLIKTPLYRNSFLIFILALFFSPGKNSAQFFDGVVHPDPKNSLIEDESIPRVKFMNSIDQNTLRQNLTVLASDELEGREPGTKGGELTQAFIMETLQSYGFGKMEGTEILRQEIYLKNASWSEVHFIVGEDKFRHMWDFLAFVGRNNDSLELQTDEVVFMGYGIDDNKYSDYRNKPKLKDKVIIIVNGEPINENGEYLITGNNQNSDWNENIQRKLDIAREQEVKCVFILENSIKDMLAANRREILRPQPVAKDENNNNFVNHAYISIDMLKVLISDERKVEELLKQPQMHVNTSFAAYLSGVMIKKFSVLEGANILGVINGGKYPNEFLTVSGHFDHVGKRGESIFYGADDNGSGTAALLSIGKTMMEATQAGYRPDRTILIIFLDAEEKGLVGSNYYVNNPLFPLENTLVNLNLDMLGRIDAEYQDKDKYIYVIGSDRLSKELHSLAVSVNAQYTGLILDNTFNGENDPNQYYFRSDHYNFAKNGVPAIFFFNGVHDDYHQVSDTVDKIEFDYLQNRTQLVFQLLWEIANKRERLSRDADL
jgi:hypothetical protein